MQLAHEPAMLRHPMRVGSAALLIVTAACGVVEKDIFSPNPDNYENVTSAGGGAGVGGAGAGTGAGSSVGGAAAGDLPCEVAAVLAAHCDSCHAANIPPILRSRDDFLGASNTAGMNLGEASLARMQDSGSPMPPTGVAPAADVQAFADWVAAGLPTGDCGGGNGGAGGNPYNTDPICTSNQIWNNGSDGNDAMYPGRACNECHAMHGKPIYAFAGTVYPTAHEPDDCYGVGSGVATVEITDNNGVVSSATTNANGNFRKSGSFAFPITVRVKANNQVLEMVTPLQQGEGDCNTCHNQDGTDGAPGRIILPF